MSERKTFNFSAGPGTLPESVIRKAQQDIWDIDGTGIGILEHSHRGKTFDRITEECEASARQLAGVGDDYAIFWMQGGATSQCYFVPANLLPEGETADYFQTGKWANDSIKEVPHYGTLHICGSSKDKNYSYIPMGDEVTYSPKPRYVHFTSNNTIMGTEFPAEPDAPAGVPLVCDMSSNMFSKPVDFKKYGLIYAGAQKNLGPAGATLLIARRDLVADPVRPLPEMMNYKNHAESEGRFNTPPTFAVYLMNEVMKWVIGLGGTAAMAEINREKADVVYDFLDAQDFYIPHARKDCRSLMNITFKCPTPELDKLFLKEAESKHLDGLKGHRSIGGMRASMYNAFPKEGAEALVSFMKSFAHEHASAVAN
ncbi:MAG: 3-phosphoserine/phosphohydroxythreonine transaminase [Phycisphaerae bacterium]|nr:3-phosphoserine/phosphohydroxythreonine transaminase [Phycisphaerae bacterium]